MEDAPHSFGAERPNEWISAYEDLQSCMLMCSQRFQRVLRGTGTKRYAPEECKERTKMPVESDDETEELTVGLWFGITKNDQLRSHPFMPSEVQAIFRTLSPASREFFARDLDVRLTEQIQEAVRANGEFMVPIEIAQRIERLAESIRDGIVRKPKSPWLIFRAQGGGVQL